MFSEIKLEKTILKINFYLICFFLNFFGSSDSSGILAYSKPKLAETCFFFSKREISALLREKTNECGTEW